MSADGRRFRFLRSYSTSVRTPLLLLLLFLLFFSPTRARLSAASATEMLALSIARWPRRIWAWCFCDAVLRCPLAAADAEDDMSAAIEPGSGLAPNAAPYSSPHQLADKALLASVGRPPALCCWLHSCLRRPRGLLAPDIAVCVCVCVCGRFPRVVCAQNHSGQHLLLFAAAIT